MSLENDIIVQIDMEEVDSFQRVPDLLSPVFLI